MRRRDKRADIVNAGIRVFSRKGFRSCSVEDILQEAHVARATFYSYFDSKKDLFVELVDGILNSLYEIARKNLEEIPGDLEEIKERTRNTVIGLFDYFSHNLEFSLIYIQEVMGMNPEIDSRVIEWQKRVAELIENVIVKGIEKGLFRPVNTNIISNLVSGALQHLGLNLFIYNQEVDIPTVADAVADYLIYGLASR